MTHSPKNYSFFILFPKYKIKIFLASIPTCHFLALRKPYESNRKFLRDRAKTVIVNFYIKHISHLRDNLSQILLYKIIDLLNSGHERPQLCPFKKCFLSVTGSQVSRSRHVMIPEVAQKRPGSAPSLRLLVSRGLIVVTSTLST